MSSLKISVIVALKSSHKLTLLHFVARVAGISRLEVIQGEPKAEPTNKLKALRDHSLMTLPEHEKKAWMRENRKTRIALKKAAEARRDPSKRKKSEKSIEERFDRSKHFRMYEGFNAVRQNTAISPLSAAQTRDLGPQMKGKDVAIRQDPQQSMLLDHHPLGDRFPAYQSGLLPFPSTLFTPTVASSLAGQYATPGSPSDHHKGLTSNLGVQESDGTTATRQSSTSFHHPSPSQSSMHSQDSPPGQNFASLPSSPLPTHSKFDAQAHSHGDSNLVIDTPELIQEAQFPGSPTSSIPFPHQSEAVRPHASPSTDKHGHGQHSDLPNSDPVVHADINDVFEYQPDEWRLWDSPPNSPIYHYK